MNKVIYSLSVLLLMGSMSKAGDILFYATNKTGQIQYVKILNEGKISCGCADWFTVHENDEMDNFFTATTSDFESNDSWKFYVNNDPKDEEARTVIMSGLNNCPEVEILIADEEIKPKIICHMGLDQSY